MKLYEAMILVTTAEASRDWDGIVRHITDILTRNGAQIVDLRKWGDHKLAYEIKHQRKATYILVHFNAPTNVIAEIRRELQLSERILRHLIVVDTDGVEPRLLSEVEEERERAAAQAQAEAPKQAPAAAAPEGAAAVSAAEPAADGSAPSEPKPQPTPEPAETPAPAEAPAPEETSPATEPAGEPTEAPADEPAGGDASQ